MKLGPLHVFVTAFVVSFLACLPLIGAASPAFAQSVQQATVDFTPLAMNGITVLGTVALAVGGVITKFLISFLSAKTNVHNVQLEMMVGDRVNAGLNNAINYATTIAKGWVSDPKNSQYMKVEFDNFFIDTAVKYMVAHYGGDISYFKLTPEKIANMVRSRMAPYLANPEPNAGLLQTVDAAPLPAPAA